MEEMKLENFDFASKLDELRTILQDTKSSFSWTKLQELKVKFTITTPDFKILEQFYETNRIKSHELAAITDRVKESVKNAVVILVNTMNYTIDKYIPFQNSITITRYEEFITQKEEGSKRVDEVIFIFNTQKLTMKQCFAFLKWWHLDEFAFSEHIKLEISGTYRGRVRKKTLISSLMEKQPLSAISDYLSSDDITSATQLLSHKHYFNVLKKYMFPKEFESNAEITLDIAKEGIVPQKRRTVSVDGSKMKFHQLVTETTPLTQYQKIIQQNQIVGIYCSVKSTNNSLLYLLIDIDVPALLYSMFPAQTVWRLTLNIAKSISQTASSLGFPSFKITYSGAKGLHLLLKVKNSGVIMDIEQQVNLPELYNYTLLPGLTTLKKEKLSSLNDKFKFTKSLLQSLLLFTVYRGNIEIPEEIKRGLQIIHPYQLFRISPDAQNRLKILLDCSSMSRGVFRLFSPHPANKLVSIPLSTDKLSEKYNEYKTVREDAKIENVMERFDSDDLELFLHTPNIVTRKNFKDLLRPDRLLPSFAVLMRFGTIYSMMRLPASFNFWYRFFEVRSFYGFIESKVFGYDRDDFENFYVFINNMALRLHIENRKYIMDLITKYLYEKRISFPLFKHELDTLYHIEFFFTIKSDIFFRDNEDSLLQLFKNEMEFNNFLNQAQEIFNIAVYTISRHVILEDEKGFSKSQRESMNNLYNEITSLTNLAKMHLEDLKYDDHSGGKEEFLIKVIFFVSRLYFASLIFVRTFHSLLEKSQVIKKWR